jgi:hypothetical protein
VEGVSGEGRGVMVWGGVAGVEWEGVAAALAETSLLSAASRSIIEWTPLRSSGDGPALLGLNHAANSI